MIENETANAGKTVFEQQIRWRFQKARASAETLAKFQETWSRFDAAIRNVSGEIIQRLCTARLVVRITNSDSGSTAAFFPRRSFFEHTTTRERSERDVCDRFVRARDTTVKNRQDAIQVLLVQIDFHIFCDEVRRVKRRLHRVFKIA